ncbi:transposase [Candidatus Uabimicrobium sp. HlEnr_7]|uniref:transposase n=1 Tax=Candidatus Uabimicrobium helgolandensis TaxID=3095367 RepID=UPI0035586415
MAKGCDCTYGTLICDLKSRKPIAVISNRDSETLEKWLEKYLNIGIVCRDRSLAYAKAINNKCPKAIQIADRFHLVHNLLEASREYVKKNLASKIEIATETKTTKVKRAQTKTKTIKIKKPKTQKHKRKLVEKVKKLHKQGMGIKQISRTTTLAKLDTEIASSYILSVPKPNRMNIYRNEIERYLHLGKNGSNPNS